MTNMYNMYIEKNTGAEARRRMCRSKRKITAKAAAWKIAANAFWTAALTLAGWGGIIAVDKLFTLVGI